MGDPLPSAVTVDPAVAVDQAPVIHRSFTLPASFAENCGPRPSSNVAGAGPEELLFSHHYAKIVAFNAATHFSLISGGTARADSDGDKAGVLPWTSTTERIIAAGPLRLYRLHSIAFLNSGRTLHAILPKSRCWCVDGRSKFVLRIRLNLYWRIEILAADEDKIEELKGVFARILQYETTVCPFKRDFTVELPELPKTPSRKRPWRAPEKPKPPRLEKALEPESPDEYTTAPSDNGSMSDTEEENAKDPTDSKDAKELTSRGDPPSSRLSTDRLIPYARPSTVPVPRSVVLPPRLTIRTSTSSSSLYPSLRSEEDAARCSTLSSSTESFHSVQSVISPLPHQPPDSNPPSPVFSSIHHDEGIHICRYRDHKRDSGNTVMASPSVASSLMASTRSNDGERSSLPSTPTLISDCENDEDWSEVLTPPRDNGLRSCHARKRALSPLPLAANLISPAAAQSRLPSALIQKACSIMLGPPVQLINLMLRIAFKIANGALRGTVSGYGETGEEIICQWDYSDGSDGFEQGTWEEDDFGVPLGRKEVARMRRVSDSSSWEVD